MNEVAAGLLGGQQGAAGWGLCDYCKVGRGVRLVGKLVSGGLPTWAGVYRLGLYL